MCKSERIFSAKNITIYTKEQADNIAWDLLNNKMIYKVLIINLYSNVFIIINIRFFN